jgi:plastocyanin
MQPMLVVAGLLLLGGAAPAGELHRIVMQDVAFSPAKITVRVGDTVEWVNEDMFAHTATANSRAWDVNLAPGKSGKITLGSPGTVGYICRNHPNLTGEIVEQP